MLKKGYYYQVGNAEFSLSSMIHVADAPGLTNFLFIYFWFLPTAPSRAGIALLLVSILFSSLPTFSSLPIYITRRSPARQATMATVDPRPGSMERLPAADDDDGLAVVSLATWNAGV